MLLLRSVLILANHVRESGVTREVFVIENTAEADTFFQSSLPIRSAKKN